MHASKQAFPTHFVMQMNEPIVYLWVAAYYFLPFRVYTINIYTQRNVIRYIADFMSAIRSIGIDIGNAI